MGKKLIELEKLHNRKMKEIEALRVELTKKRDDYNQLCERLWKIVNEK